MTSQPASPEVMDYEGSGYRTDFWEGQGRDYEDQTERVALRKLLPAQGGKRLLELGAGFGRLTNEYDAYDQVILVDYSSTLLQEARAHLGDNPRYKFVAANIYKLPIADGACDGAAMVRVIHHFADVPAALQQIRQTLAPNSTFILEFANKRNLKAIVRHLLKQQDWNPHALEPVEFIKLNFDFHPKYMLEELGKAGFNTEQKLSLSYLRMGILKRTLPTSLMVGVDKLLQPTAALGTYSPSVFTKNITTGTEPAANLAGNLFKCPECGSLDMTEETEKVVCNGCELHWPIENGIYNFKTPLG